jgi:hypothetical protein
VRRSGRAYIVEGSIRRSGDHIRVTAQWIDARDGIHRWSETYDRNTSDALKVQDEIAARLVRGLQLEVVSHAMLEHLADRQCQYPPQRIEKSRFERRWRGAIGIMHRLPAVE